MKNYSYKEQWKGYLLMIKSNKFIIRNSLLWTNRVLYKKIENYQAKILFKS
jgi:hypothetical protein